MTPNSNLVTNIIPAHSDNFARGRNGVAISEITIHHTAGNITIQSLGAMWQTPGRRVSSTYGINGRMVGQYLSEADTPFTNSNLAANRRAVTIETANTLSGSRGGEAGWPVSDESFDTLIKLVADIARRNNLTPLVPGSSLTWHSMYSATVCPGPFLLSRIQRVADEANRINAGPSSGGGVLYGVARQVIALSDRRRAEEYAARLNANRTDTNAAFYYVIERPR